MGDHDDFLDRYIKEREQDIERLRNRIAVNDATNERLRADNERLRALLADLPDEIKAACEAEAKKYSHSEEKDYRAGIRWGGQVGHNIAKEATDE